MLQPLLVFEIEADCYPNSLDDLVVRTEVNKLVTDLVNLDRVRSLLRSLTCRRRFLRLLEEKRKAAQLEQGATSPHLVAYFRSLTDCYLSIFLEIPSIVVDDMPETPIMTSRDITTSVYGPYGNGNGVSPPGSPSPKRQQFNTSQDMSFSLEIAPHTRLQRSANLRRNSEQSNNTLSMFSRNSVASPYVLCLFLVPPTGFLTSSVRDRRNSITEEDPEEIVNAMQSSVWGGE